VIRSDSIRPNRDRLFEIAVGQAGYFTTKQAQEAGYSTHLLRKHAHAGRVARSRRGIYRLVHFPAGENEDLVAAWLWSEQAGIISQQTALSQCSLSDVLPEDRSWFGSAPITSPRRTLNDCARDALSPELLRIQACKHSGVGS